MVRNRLRTRTGLDHIAAACVRSRHAEFASARHIVLGADFADFEATTAVRLAFCSLPHRRGGLPKATPGFAT